MAEHAVTLQELLDSRERRAQEQRRVLSKYDGVLISVTLNIPGAIKDKPTYRKALQKGLALLTERFSEEQILYSEMRHLKTGSEGYLVVSEMEPMEVKTITVAVEEESPLGRLFDMDVMTAEGSVSRASLGMPGRRCLLCGQEAKVCARSQKHPMEDLLKEVDRILDAG